MGCARLPIPPSSDGSCESWDVELVSPDQSLPLLPDWKSRSIFIEKHGQVEFFHYDFRTQAVTKLARGYERDLADVRTMLDRGLVSREELTEALDAIHADLLRYPALDREAFENRVKESLDIDA